LKYMIKIYENVDFSLVCSFNFTSNLTRIRLLYLDVIFTTHFLKPIINYI